MKGFTVIDNKTGNYPDCEKIALDEDWAKHLCYCDIDTFAITEDGSVILMDDCGKCAYCPEGRFTVVTDNNVGDKWISVKDRLPAVGEDVLVITSSSDRNMAVWRLFGNAENRQAHWEDEVGDGLVLGAATHWMPLPQPPKGE